jgi:hypothetical protein
MRSSKVRCNQVHRQFQSVTLESIYMPPAEPETGMQGNPAQDNPPLSAEQRGNTGEDEPDGLPDLHASLDEWKEVSQPLPVPDTSSHSIWFA